MFNCAFHTTETAKGYLLNNADDFIIGKTSSYEQNAKSRRDEE
jgi:hypothetical protein